MTAKPRHARNQTANAGAQGNEATTTPTKPASEPESSTVTPIASAVPHGATMEQQAAGNPAPWPTTIRTVAANWLRKAWTRTTLTGGEDSAKAATTDTPHEHNPADGISDWKNLGVEAYRRMRAQDPVMRSLFRCEVAWQKNNRWERALSRIWYGHIRHHCESGPHPHVLLNMDTHHHCHCGATLRTGP